MKAGEPLTVREASFISLLMGHTERTGAATVRFTMHVDGSLDGQIAKTQVFSLTHTLLVLGRANTVVVKKRSRWAAGLLQHCLLSSYVIR